METCCGKLIFPFCFLFLRSRRLARRVVPRTTKTLILLPKNLLLNPLADLGLPFLLPFCHDPNLNGICRGRILSAQNLPVQLQIIGLNIQTIGLVFNPYENVIFLKTLIINPIDSDQICRFGWRKKTQKSPNILPCNFTLKINSLENIA